MTRLKNPTLYAKATPRDMLSKVKEIVDEEVQRTKAFDGSSEDDIPVFHRKELGLGHVIGRGGFCVVRELDSIHLLMGDIADDEEISIASRSSGLGSLVSKYRLPGRRPSGSGAKTGKAINLPENGGGEVPTRQSLARSVRAGKRRAKYVVKQVEPTLLEKDKVSMLKGTIDLVLEAKYLASLSHPHVITLQGVSAVNYDKEMGYFIILEKLNDVLSKRLNSWMQQYRATRGITGFVTGGKKRAASLLSDRLMVAYDIADAMSYLHSKRIVYRDLKPDNVGFNHDDAVKIFDFGLAKELSEEDKTENGLYRMTGLTGAIRYMAPEVGMNKPYNLKADVYSWSMVLWYILALEPPMGMYTPNMFIERVFKKDTRPAINQKWSKGLAHLLKCCWSSDIDLRPSFQEICGILREEVSRIDPNSQFDSDELPRDSITVTTVESGRS